MFHEDIHSDVTLGVLNMQSAGQSVPRDALGRDRGRPKFDLHESSLRFLVFDLKFKCGEMAAYFGIHQRTIQRRPREYDIAI